jgi:hypothetical protein
MSNESSRRSQRWRTGAGEGSLEPRTSKRASRCIGAPSGWIGTLSSVTAKYCQGGEMPCSVRQFVSALAYSRLHCLSEDDVAERRHGWRSGRHTKPQKPSVCVLLNLTGNVSRPRSLHAPRTFKSTITVYRTEAASAVRGDDPGRHGVSSPSARSSFKRQQHAFRRRLWRSSKITRLSAIARRPAS